MKACLGVLAVLVILMCASLAFGQEGPQFYSPSTQLGPDVGPPQGAGGQPVQPAPKSEAQPQAPTSIQIGSATVSIHADSIVIQGQSGGHKGHGGRGHGRKSIRTAGLTTAKVQALVRRELQGYAKATDIQRVERKLDELIARSTAPAVPGPTASATTAAMAATGGIGMIPGLGIPWSWVIWAAIIITIVVLARNAARSMARREERMVNNAPALVAVQRHSMELPRPPAAIGPSEGDSLAIHRDGYGNISGIERHRWPSRPEVRTGLRPGDGVLAVGEGHVNMYQVPPVAGQERTQRGNGPAADAAAGRTTRRNGGTTTRRVAETTEPAPAGAGEAAVEAVKRNGHEAQQGDGHGQEEAEQH